ncbi:MAG: hypothetical protein CMC38_01100 [Flavobacteriaceae bacterium]|nr:hypothetical protein [Flavobacteriaceae bacterium]|tara:strand:- start:322 stop:1023 length:702 start_codon:yes stop_codon:yes gene_type:complete
MKKVIILLMLSICYNGFSQNYDISQDQLLNSGNVLIQRLMKYDGDAKGNPYLNKEFSEGKLLFNNGKQYNALIRLNVSEQKFEIKKNINSEPSAIEIDDTVKVYIGETSYKLYSFNLGSKTNTIGILEECLVLENYSLFYFPQKKLEMPQKSAIPAPTSGYSKPPRPEWRNNGVYLIFHNNKAYKLPTSHKKMMDLKLFNEKLYKKYRKENKLNLKNKESLKGLITYFNSLDS